MSLNKPKIFIISWRGQHENAEFIANKLITFSPNVYIVYSDPDNSFSPSAPCHLIKRPNNLFWEDKFKNCLDLCNDQPMMVIHADCQCDNWENLVKRYFSAREKIKNLGVWAPYIRGTYYTLEKSEVFGYGNDGLRVAALTDGIVFALSTELVKRMKLVKYGDNPIGWGIDLLFCSAAYTFHQLIIIDNTVLVDHPKSRGYKTEEAVTGMNKFFSQFYIQELIQCKLLRSYIESDYKSILLDVRPQSLEIFKKNGEDFYLHPR